MIPNPCRKPTPIHPDGCATTDDDGNVICGWCEEVNKLTEEGRRLRDQLHKTAVIVAGGEVNIYGEIGYAVVYHGIVNMRDPTGTGRPSFSKLPSGD
ncbi:MAG: hypothetical protein V3S55_09660 [Nitrospiraceae bacterium]